VLVGVGMRSMPLLIEFSTRIPLIFRFLHSGFNCGLDFPFLGFLLLVEDSLVFTFVKVGTRVAPHSSVWLWFSYCCLPRRGMEPSGNDLKRILHQHEEFSQANSSDLQHISTKIGKLEQALMNVMNLLTI
jgi:hypothetical protein